MSKNEATQTPKRTITKPKSVEQLLKRTSAEIKSLYKVVNEKILELSPEINQRTTSQNIIYETSVIIVELKVQKSRLRLLIRTENGEINDPKKLAEVVPETHEWGKLTHRIKLSDEKDVDDMMDLVKQSFRSTQ